MVTETKATELTGKQRLFAKEYLVDRNGTAAAKRAGYSVAGAHVEASRMLKNPKIASAIGTLEASTEIAKTVDREYVISKLVHFTENADTDTTRLRATELLGKTLRMFVEVSESLTVHVPAELAEFSLDELRAIKRQQALPAASVTTQAADAKTPD